MCYLQILAGVLTLAIHGRAPARIQHYPGDVTVEIITDDGRVLPVPGVTIPPWV